MLSRPVLSVTPPAALSVTVPAPASDPIVSLKPARLKNAPPATVTALFWPTALAMPSCSVPALIVVAPL